MPDQTEQFLQEAAKVIPPPQGALNDVPRVPFQTDLKLSREQEDKLIQHAFKRLKTLENELGRDVTIQPNWWNNQVSGVSSILAGQGLQPSDTFLGKRSRFDATFANDVSWRPYTVGPDSIFFSSNIPVPVVRRVCRQMIARAKNNFYGTEPWFSVDPAPVPEFNEQGATERADRIEKFLRFKLGDTQSDSKASGGRAISQAMILGEVAVKTSYVMRDQIFNVESMVLHDVEDQPVRASDGNYVTDEDQWVDAQDGNGTQVLKRDPSVVQPPAPIYKKTPLDRRQVLFEGARSEPIYYKDFLCPLTAQDVQTADCIIHLYDKPVMEFVDLVVKRGMVDDTAEDRLGAAQKMVALVQSMSDNSPQPKSASTMSTRPGENTLQAPSMETGGPVSEFAEFYLWFDANGDGVAENIMLICDKKTQAPIFYDHVANVTTDGLRPIKIVRINPIEGRWYGKGIMELFESYGTIIDLLVNRWNFSQSRAGRIDFWKPTDTQEGDRDPNLKLNWGGTYTVKPGMDPEKVLHPVYLTDIKFEQLEKMFSYFQQLLTAEAGVLNANDAQSAGLESSNLATGIISIQESGDELFDPFLQELKPCLQDILQSECDVTLANMNPTEVFTYLNGSTMGIDQITPQDVRGLKFKITITLSKWKDQKTIQTSAAAAALVERFYQLSPAVQVKVQEFYRRQVRALDPACDVRTVIDPVQPSPPESEAPKKAVTIAIKGESLAPEQIDELLQEDFDVQAAGAPKLQEVGSLEKTGEMAPNTDKTAQLSQRLRKKAS